MNAVLALFEQQALTLRALTKCQLKECILLFFLSGEVMNSKFVTQLKLALRVIKVTYSY